MHPECFGHLTALLKPYAPLGLLLEGGYNLAATAACVEACVRALLGERPMPLRGTRYVIVWWLVGACYPGKMVWGLLGRIWFLECLKCRSGERGGEVGSWLDACGVLEQRCWGELLMVRVLLGERPMPLRGTRYVCVCWLGLAGWCYPVKMVRELLVWCGSPPPRVQVGRKRGQLGAG